jgi:hypothetical protein
MEKLNMKENKFSRCALFALVLFAIIILALSMTRPIYSSQMDSKPWLMQFVNGPVKVTFIEAPPSKDKTIEARLISVESSGLVLRLPQDRDKFYPYSNMISVDPK